MERDPGITAFDMGIAQKFGRSNRSTLSLAVLDDTARLLPILLGQLWTNARQEVTGS